MKNSKNINKYRKSLYCSAKIYLSLSKVNAAQFYQGHYDDEIFFIARTNLGEFFQKLSFRIYFTGSSFKNLAMRI